MFCGIKYEDSVEETINGETCTISYQDGRNREVFFLLQHTEFLSRLIQITPPGLTKTFVSPKK